MSQICSFFHFTLSIIVTYLVKSKYSLVKSQEVVGTNAIVETHIMYDLLAMHTLTGCDTVTSHFGIRKEVTLKVLYSCADPLSLLGDSS